MLTPAQRFELLRRLKALHRDLRHLDPMIHVVRAEGVAAEYDGIKYTLAVMGYRVIERGDYWPTRIVKAA